MSARIRFRQRNTKKNMCFFCPSRALDCCRFSKKICLFREIKNHSEKKKFITGDKKNIFPAMFFFLFFSSPSSIFFSNRSKVFYFVVLINFSRNLSNVFFYFIALINFSKNRLNVFFLKCFFFHLPSSSDFGFFLIKNRYIKHSGLTFQQV